MQASEADTSDQLRLTFDGPVSDISDAAEPITNAGDWDVQVRSLTTNGGMVRTVPGLEGTAIHLSAATAGEADSSAVLYVSPPDGEGMLSAADRLLIGADFRLDGSSSDEASDNGDNILQRGLWGDAAQYKIQVDHRVPSCLIRGRNGEVYVAAEAVVEPRDWYRLTCERMSGQVILRLARLGDEGTRQSRTWVGVGSTGAMDLRGVPVSIGGKVSRDGHVVRNSDQFNGSLDNVFIVIRDDQ